MNGQTSQIPERNGAILLATFPGINIIAVLTESSNFEINNL